MKPSAFSTVPVFRSSIFCLFEPFIAEQANANSVWKINASKKLLCIYPIKSIPIWICRSSRRRCCLQCYIYCTCEYESFQIPGPVPLKANSAAECDFFFAFLCLAEHLLRTVVLSTRRRKERAPRQTPRGL